MTDAVKRKEPEPSTDASGEAAEKAKETAPDKPVEDKAAASAPAAASSAEKVATDVPDPKRLKPTPPDLKMVRRQVEYYFSDENLRYDKFFNEKISGEKDGWLDMNLILSCAKMKAMRASKEDVSEALKESKLEVREDGAAIRRQGNLKLPELQARPTHQKKNSLHAHDGGVVASLSGVPEEQSWVQVKEKLAAKLPQKVQLWFVSEVNDKNRCIVATSPFDGDQKFFEELTLEVGGATLKSEVCQGDSLHQSLKLVPKHVRDKRERESRKRQKERNRPIILGTQRFLNVPALRGRVKEILNSRSDGEQLKPDGSDFKLIKSLLEFHPTGPEKSKGLVGIKVAKSIQGDSRCFFMIKEGGVEEDFSAKKCLDAVELNPPYVAAVPKESPKTDKVEEPTTSSGAAVAKVEEPTTSSGAAVANAKAEEPAAAGDAGAAKAEEPATAGDAGAAKAAEPATAGDAGSAKAAEPAPAEDTKKAEEPKQAEAPKEAEESKQTEEPK